MKSLIRTQQQINLKLLYYNNCYFIEGLNNIKEL